MAVPKRRKSRSKRDTRRATHKISAKAYNECGNCGAPKEPHRICPSCGWYKERYVLEVVEVES
ncbi:MAG: 50S ribosomal protein L32 [Myxococcales bacterium]|nr:50S ribosomal protein L32 [Myxococcales bacterium]